MSKYILVDEYLGGDHIGKPKYFKGMTGIGPASTPNIEEAQHFDTEEEAKQSPAHRHWSADWKVEKI